MFRTPSVAPGRTLVRSLARRQRTRRPRRLRVEALQDRTVPATADAISFDSHFGNATLQLKSPGKLKKGSEELKKGSGVFSKKTPDPFSGPG
jgi:hypothetical protein